MRKPQGLATSSTLTWSPGAGKGVTNAEEPSTLVVHVHTSHRIAADHRKQKDAAFHRGRYYVDCGPGCFGARFLASGPRTYDEVSSNARCLAMSKGHTFNSTINFHNFVCLFVCLFVEAVVASPYWGLNLRSPLGDDHPSWVNQGCQARSQQQGPPIDRKRTRKDRACLSVQFQTTQVQFEVLL